MRSSEGGWFRRFQKKVVLTVFGWVFWSELLYKAGWVSLAWGFCGFFFGGGVKPSRKGQVVGFWWFVVSEDSARFLIGSFKRVSDSNGCT